jgi:hypothetical protein
MSGGRRAWPNPRLQRTPPASPPSPLSRKPLGRQTFTVGVQDVRT